MVKDTIHWPRFLRLCIGVLAWYGRCSCFFCLDVLTWNDFLLAYSWLQSDEAVTPGAKPPGYPCQWSCSKKAGTAGNSRFLHKSQHSAIQRILLNVPSRAVVPVGIKTRQTCYDKGSEFKWTFLTKPHIIVACNQWDKGKSRKLRRCYPSEFIQTANLKKLYPQICWGTLGYFCLRHSNIEYYC